MADASRKHPSSAPGPWFVDRTCIDCDVCREHAPEIFAREGDGSYVVRPPRTPDETRRAWLALQACPVACIGAGRGEKEVEIGPGVLMIPVPGHTRGSVAFLVDDEFLFTGDSLAWDADDGLYAFPDYCWHSWPEQLRSLGRLAKKRFRWVLPGHGRRTPRAMDNLPEQLLRYVATASNTRSRDPAGR